MLPEICIGLHCNSGHLCHEVSRSLDCWIEYLHDIKGCGYERPVLLLIIKALILFKFSLQPGVVPFTASVSPRAQVVVVPQIPTITATAAFFTSSALYTFSREQ